MSFKKSTKILSLFSLAMLNVATVMSLRGLPVMAETGYTMFFYLLFASLLFLIPTALVAAELASAFPGPGGVYRWVKEAFGSRWGLTAIWLQWAQNIIWYPTILAFIAGTLAYALFRPELAANNWYTAGVIISIYWIASFITFRGLKVASRVATLGVVFGTIIPGILIIALGISWIATGHNIAFTNDPVHILPDLSHFSDIAFLASIVLLFAGMEVNAVHVQDLKDPRRQYPKAIFLSTMIIIIIFTLGASSIASVVPLEKLSLTAGLMETFSEILQTYHIHFLLPLIGAFLAFGSIGGLLAWISGPSKGLLTTARNGEIPPFLAHLNKHGVQTNILIIQGTIVTALASLYLIMKNVDVAFFLLSTMTVSVYLLMYVLMFAAAIKLRYSHPNIERRYQIPGGKFGMWLVAGTGLLAVLFAIGISTIPPEQLKIGTPHLYISLVICGMVFFLSAPLIIHRYRKGEWQKQIVLDDELSEDILKPQQTASVDPA